MSARSEPPPMPDAPSAGDGRVDREHLQRSGRVWDRWARRYGHSERDFAPLYDDAVDRLAVGPGDAVLEVGCGPGTNVERIRDAVAPGGRLVAVDYSPEMVARAASRARDLGWNEVDVVRADASSVAFAPGRFDAALASLSMSVLPDPDAAARRVRDALAPGGRFVVLDLRRVPDGPLRIVNPLLERFYRWFANWNADADVLDALRTTFADVEVEETYFGGAAYRAVARKQGDAEGPFRGSAARPRPT